MKETDLYSLVHNHLANQRWDAAEELLRGTHKSTANKKKHLHLLSYLLLCTNRDGELQHIAEDCIEHVSTLATETYYLFARSYLKTSNYGQADFWLSLVINTEYMTLQSHNIYSTLAEIRFGQKRFSESYQYAQYGYQEGCTSRSSNFIMAASKLYLAGKPHLNILDKQSDLNTSSNKVCIITEQGGYGDNIMSVRCLAEISDRYNFILIAPDQLAALFRTYPWLDRVIPTRDLELHSTKLAIDECCGWYRLPNERYMHEQTYNPLVDLKPSHRRANAASYFYNYHSDSHNWLKIFLQERRALKSNCRALIVGIAWMSGVMCDNRYLCLKNFERIFDNQSLRFISLQKGHNQEQLIYASNYSSRFMKCQNLISGCSDFADTALTAAYCDHVVTVDTSVAHVCGFLGVRTHILCARDKYKTEQWEEGKYWNDTYLREIHNANVTVYDFDHTSSESLEKAVDRISHELAMN